VAHFSESMPARRPGGKYAGKIARVKPPELLAAEKEEEERKNREALSQRADKARERRLLDDRGLRHSKEEEEEARKQAIVNLLVSSKGGNVKKFFTTWVVGVRNIKREKAVEKRQDCWNRSCRACRENGGCSAHKLLRDKTYAHPLAALNLSNNMFPPHLQSLMQSSQNRPITASSSHASAQLTRHSSTPALPPMNSTAWLDPESANVVEVIHCSTGKRCLLDRDTMRIRFADTLL